MARTLRERKAEKPPTEVPVRRALPRIRREIHSPVATLSRSAAHMRLNAESTYGNPLQADFACMVLRNLSTIAPEGSTPLSTKFLRMLG
jgi:hypothetical protein